jgi:nucleoside-diphosphate-sugar epimerase
MKVLNGNKILIIGASSFIGSHLVTALNEHNVTIYTANRSANTFSDPEITHSRLDITDLSSVKKTIDKIRPDYVFNLSGYVEGGRELENIWPTFKINLEGTINLFMALQRVSFKRLIIMGSLDEHQMDLERLSPVSPYAASKITSSAYARMFHSLYDLPVVIARPYMVYGPNQKDQNKLVPYTILSILKAETPDFSSGTREADWVYISDVVDALIRCAERPNLEGKTVHVGTGKLNSVKKVVTTIFEILQVKESPKFSFIPDRKMETIISANVEQTMQQINWEAKVDLRSGLKATINWYQENLGKFL